MQLTLHTDYALRVLIFLATRPDSGELDTTADIADTFEISRHHVIKICTNLSDHGYIESSRGRGGGISLAQSPSEISVGEVVRKMEKNLDVVECMGPDPDCLITPVCRLQKTFRNASRAFLEVLDEQTLASVVENENELCALLCG